MMGRASKAEARFVVVDDDGWRSKDELGWEQLFYHAPELRKWARAKGEPGSFCFYGENVGVRKGKERLD
jgi:hypothetical protein